MTQDVPKHTPTHTHTPTLSHKLYHYVSTLLQCELFFVPALDIVLEA